MAIDPTTRGGRSCSGVAAAEAELPRQCGSRTPVNGKRCRMGLAHCRLAGDAVRARAGVSVTVGEDETPGRRPARNARQVRPRVLALAAMTCRTWVRQLLGDVGRPWR